LRRRTAQADAKREAIAATLPPVPDEPAPMIHKRPSQAMLAEARRDEWRAAAAEFDQCTR
jgi:hypothetical protein